MSEYIPYLKGRDLQDALGRLVSRSSSRKAGMYHTTNEEKMSAAQKLLLDNGYRLLPEAVMYEPGFVAEYYKVTFESPPRQYPTFISLRYLSDPQPALPKALMFYDGDVLTQYEPSDLPRRTIYRLDKLASYDADKLIASFVAVHPGVPHFWTPVFKHSSIASV